MSKEMMMKESYIQKQKSVLLETQKYIIFKEVLGTGGLGKVLRGIDAHSGKLLAFKKIIKTLQPGSLQKEFYFKEIRALKQLQQKVNILKFHDAFTHKNSNFIVTELCEGGNLSQYLKNNKITRQMGYYLMTEIIKGYLQISRSEYIHRDLKLSNILIKQQHQICIADFGFAIKLDEIACEKSNKVGSINYMAPEVISRNQYSYKSDIWALGVILYELLYHKKPWDQKNQQHLYKIQMKNCKPNQHFLNTNKLKESNMTYQQNIIDKQFLLKTICFDQNERVEPQQLLHLLLKNKGIQFINNDKFVIEDIADKCQIYLNLCHYLYYLRKLIIKIQNEGNTKNIQQILKELSIYMTKQLMKTLTYVQTLQIFPETARDSFKNTPHYQQISQKCSSFRKLFLSNFHYVCNTEKYLNLTKFLKQLHETITIRHSFSLFLLYDNLVTLKWILSTIIQNEGIQILKQNLNFQSVIKALRKNTKLEQPNISKKIQLQHLLLLEKKLNLLKVI